MLSTDSATGLLGLAGELPEPELPLGVELGDGLPAAHDTQMWSRSTTNQAAVHAVKSLAMLVRKCYQQYLKSQAQHAHAGCSNSDQLGSSAGPDESTSTCGLPPLAVPLHSVSRQVQHCRCCQYALRKKLSWSLTLGLRAAPSLT